MARAADGSGVVVYNDGHARGVPLSSEGQLGASVSLTTVDTESITAASAVGGAFVVADLGNGRGGEWGYIERWSSELASETSLPSVKYVKLASSPNGFAMVGQPPSTTTWQFSSFKLDGTSVCAAVDLPASFVPGSLVATPTGYLVISSGAVKAQEILANCSLGVSFDIDPGPASDVHAASGPDGYGLVWQNTDTGIPMRRLFGSRYCD